MRKTPAGPRPRVSHRLALAGGVLACVPLAAAPVTLPYTETLELRTADNTLLESVRYDDSEPDAGLDNGLWPASPDGDGPSLVRLHHLMTANHASSWRASSVNDGTPGAPDSPSFAAWLSSNGLPSAGSIAPSGHPALVHFASGTGPASVPPLPAVNRGASDDTISFRRPITAPDDVRFFIERSPDLAQWPVSLEIDAPASPLTARTRHGDGTETLTLRLPAGSGTAFYRLRYLTR